MKMRFVKGPFAGQTADISFRELRIHYYGYRPEFMGGYDLPVAELVWFVHGTDKHCYQPVQNTHYGEWRLVYRDTF